jgi:hypothetical protein
MTQDNIAIKSVASGFHDILWGSSLRDMFKNFQIDTPLANLPKDSVVPLIENLCSNSKTSTRRSKHELQIPKKITTNHEKDFVEFSLFGM